MWVKASLCPTIGSQSGQSAWQRAKGKQPFLVHMTHLVKLGEILDLPKIIKPNIQKHNKNRQHEQIKELSGQFKSISIPLIIFAKIHMNLTFGCCLAPFAAQTSISH